MLTSFPIEKEIKIYMAYARSNDDEEFVRQFKKMLKQLGRLPKVTCFDIGISAGTEWRKKKQGQLETADIILLLVSWTFLDSDYCVSTELGQAIESHKSGRSRVIPIILQKCPWEDTQLNDLEPLPKDGPPFEEWPSWAQALNNTYEGIKQVIKELQSPPKLEDLTS